MESTPSTIKASRPVPCYLPPYLIQACHPPLATRSTHFGPCFSFPVSCFVPSLVPLVSSGLWSCKSLLYPYSFSFSFSSFFSFRSSDSGTLPPHPAHTSCHATSRHMHASSVAYLGPCPCNVTPVGNFDPSVIHLSIGRVQESGLMKSRWDQAL